MVPVYGTTLVKHRVLVLRGDQKVFDGFATLEVSLDAISTTDLFDTFAKTLCVGYDNMTLTLHSMVGRLGRVVAPIIDLSGRPVKSFLHFVQGPFGVVAFSESFPDRSMMGATTLPSLPTMECKVRVILSYPTHKVFAKVSKRSVVDMASKLTSMVAKPSKTFWSPLRTRTLCLTKVVPYTGTNATT